MLFLPLGCQAPAVDHSTGFGSTPEVTTTGSTTTAVGTTGSTGGSSETGGGAVVSTSTGSDEGGESAMSTFDLGTMADFGPGKPVGCKGKIDFLFVISRSANMQGLQDRLIDAFPAFIATIEAKFDDFDYHILVVDGEPDWGLAYCTDECPKPFDECNIDDYPCDSLDLLTACDSTIGAGNVFAAGRDAANKPCAVDGGRRYLTRDQTDLEATFACIAQVGTSGRGWIGEALTAAVSTQLVLPGGCNDGFLRKDALLMVTMIAQNYDVGDKPFGSAGTPKEWAQAVLKAKHGDPESIVMLNILDPDCPPQDRVCEMARMFPYNYIGQSWYMDYGPQFAAASELVGKACEGFSPPG